MQIGMFDEERRLEKISKIGDSLEKLNRVVNWEMFRPILNQVFKKEMRGKGGRPPYDYVMLFKILVLQRIYNLSDEQTEYQIYDRMSFMRFLGLTLSDRVPDAKTIWLFRDTLTQAKVIRRIFELFNKQLEEAHLITRTGTIVDATFVEAPRQHNSHEEKEKIKKGEVPEEWQKPENKNKLRQKDIDAKWTRKANVAHYGYKNHVKADAESKVITNYETTTASVHDSQVLPELLDENDQVIYADSAYWGAPVREALPEGIKNEIQERSTKQKALTQEQKENNNRKAKTRCRIEHIFGFMTVKMHGLSLRSIGIERADFNIGLTNLVYNLFRYEFFCRKGLVKG